MEKVRAQLAEITRKTLNSRKTSNALKGDKDEGSTIDSNAINSKGNTLSAADHTASPQFIGSLTGDSSCGSIRWVHVFLITSLFLRLCPFTFLRILRRSRAEHEYKYRHDLRWFVCRHLVFYVVLFYPLWFASLRRNMTHSYWTILLLSYIDCPY